MIKKVVLFSMMVLVSLPVLGLQVSTSVRFDVASIKLSKPSGSGVAMQFQPGGRFSATGITAWNLILLAFGVRPYEIDTTAVPSWVNSTRFDILAKADELRDLKISEMHDQMMRRVKTLLSERFSLQTHQSTIQRSGLALIKVRDGSNLQVVGDDSRCKANSNGPGQILTMQTFALLLSQRFDAPVIDQTGLHGNFCIWLRWSTDDGTPQSLGLGWGPTTDLSAQTAGPSLPTALQEQLGLQVRSQKIPVQMLVIDQIAMPSAN